jgi:hypothetical protein
MGFSSVASKCFPSFEYILEVTPSSNSWKHHLLLGLEIGFNIDWLPTLVKL